MIWQYSLKAECSVSRDVAAYLSIFGEGLNNTHIIGGLISDHDKIFSQLALKQRSWLGHTCQDILNLSFDILSRALQARDSYAQ